MTADMPIKALAPWFGGKGNLAALIVRELGRHRSYWEPFCGSMAVLLAKPAAYMETVNDLHRDLINLARVIRDPIASPALYRRLRRIFHSEMDYRQAIAAQTAPALAEDTPDLDRAQTYFITSWMGRKGLSGTPMKNTGSFGVRYTALGGTGGVRWLSAVRSIPAWRRRLARVTILSRDGLELLGRIEDADGTAIYCDPPYLVKGTSYLHDFDADHHAALAAAVARFRRARVVVSYYDHPALADLYPPARWSRVTVTVNKAMALGGRRGVNQTTADEVLLLNGPSHAQPDNPTPPGGLFQ